METAAARTARGAWRSEADGRRGKMGAAAKAHSNKSLPPQPARVLVVDDEPGLIEVIDDVVGRGMGCCVVTAANIAQARKIIATQGIELLVADLNLPDGDGMTLLPA